MKTASNRDQWESLRDILKDEKLLHRVELVNVLFLVLGTILGWALGSWRFAGGILLGGLIATLSFQAMKWQVRRAFRDPRRLPGKGGLLLRYYVRFFATAFAVLTVVYYGWVDLIGFLVGLSVVMLAIVSVGMQEVLILLIKGER